MRSPREVRWSNKEVGRALIGWLREKEPPKRTKKGRQESVGSWKLTVEHFRRRVYPSVEAAGVQEILPGIKCPLKLVVRVSLVTSAKTVATLYSGLMPNHRRLRDNGR